MKEQNNEPYSEDEFRKIRNKAQVQASRGDLNEIWKRAYANLAEAADYLDALCARSNAQSEEI